MSFIKGEFEIKKFIKNYLSLFVLFLTILTMKSLELKANDILKSDSVFLKAYYALDEPRFLCVDIPGHKARVNISRSLTVHTCKEGIWHQDELFDVTAISQGLLKMTAYNLCVEAISLMNNTELVLKSCNQTNMQNWLYRDYRLILKSDMKKCLTIGSEPSRLTRGGQRLKSKHVARSLVITDCSEQAFTRQMWRFEVPQERTGSIMPFKK